MNSKEKTAFRGKRIWKEFRALEISKRGSRCELCGKTFSPKDLDLHHLYPEFYDVLDPSNFKLLCTEDHDDVERWAKKVGAHNSGHVQIPNFNALMSWMGPFLPIAERSSDKYIDQIRKEIIRQSEKKVVDIITVPVL